MLFARLFFKIFVFQKSLLHAPALQARDNDPENLRKTLSWRPWRHGG
jgi:hypothetical protein